MNKVIKHWHYLLPTIALLPALANASGLMAWPEAPAIKRLSLPEGCIISPALSKIHNQQRSTLCRLVCDPDY